MKTLTKTQAEFVVDVLESSIIFNPVRQGHARNQFAKEIIERLSGKSYLVNHKPAEDKINQLIKKGKLIV